VRALFDTTIVEEQEFLERPLHIPEGA